MILFLKNNKHDVMIDTPIKYNAKSMMIGHKNNNKKNRIDIGWINLFHKYNTSINFFTTDILH